MPADHRVGQQAAIRFARGAAGIVRRAARPNWLASVDRAGPLHRWSVSAQGAKSGLCGHSCLGRQV